MRTAYLAIATAACGLLLGADRTASGSIIDLERTAAGSEPFSDLLLDTAPAWRVLLRPGLTADTAVPEGRAVLAERGMGNPVWTDLGLVQKYESIDSRMRRLIWDLLAAQPIPLVLYVDPFGAGSPQPDLQAPPEARSYPTPSSAVHGDSPGRSRAQSASTPQAIPEPTSLLMALGGIAVATRRKRRRGGER